MEQATENIEVAPEPDPENVAEAMAIAEQGLARTNAVNGSTAVITD